MQITLPITLTIAAAAALINIWLGARVSQLRLRHKVSMGDAGNPQLVARMRAHLFGMERPAPSKLRMIGILITWTVLVGLALYALAIPYIEGASAQA